MLAEHMDASVYIDVTAKMHHSEMCQVYHGHDGYGAWCDQWAKVDTTQLQRHFIIGPSADTVFVKETYVPAVSATGRTATHTVTDMMKWEVGEDGKVRTFKRYWGQPHVLDALFVPMPESIPQSLKTTAEAHAQELGMITTDGTERTYSELLERVSKAGTALKNLGLDHEGRVAVISLNSGNYFECYYSVPWAGGWVVPIDSAQARRHRGNVERLRMPNGDD